MCDYTALEARDLAFKLALYIDERYKDTNSISGIRSGFPTVDAMTHGFQKGNLITICSNIMYPKNCFVMQLLHNIIIKDKIPCGFLSYVMNYQQFGLSLINRETLIPVSKMVSGMLKEKELKDIENSLDTILTSKIVIPRLCSSSFNELCNIIRESVEKYDLRIIYIDSLNTIPNEQESGNYKNRLINFLKKLKMLAVELDISIITDYYCYENVREIVMGNIDYEILGEKTGFVYLYSDVVLQLQNISGKRKGFDFNQYELEIFCREYGSSRYKSLRFDSKAAEFRKRDKSSG